MTATSKNFWIGPNVKILELDVEKKFISVIMKVDVKDPAELIMYSSRLEAAEKLEKLLSYLCNEQFVPEPVDTQIWTVKVTACTKNTNIH